MAKYTDALRKVTGEFNLYKASWVFKFEYELPGQTIILAGEWPDSDGLKFDDILRSASAYALDSENQDGVFDGPFWVERTITTEA